jgi:hypothetical protein
VPLSSGFDNIICQSVASARELSGNKPVIWLETGYQTIGKVRTPQQQAQYVVSASRAALRSGMEGLFIYQYLDNPDEKVARERHFGLLNEDRVAKPAWGTYGATIKSYSP